MDITQYKKHEPFFGSWHITKFLGEGNFGKVFEIQREDFGEFRAALKIITVPQNDNEIRSLKSSGLDDAGVSEYFDGVVKDVVSEFVLMNKLKGNSNIVSYEDHHVIPREDGLSNDIFIRMELLTPLPDYTEKTDLTRKDVIKLGIDMCHALELCQKHNIIHRDIKPENIFVSDNGHFKLGDFGIARTIEKTISNLSTKGTYTYMAPEVSKREEYGSSVDIYSLGIVMYRLLNKNRIPFLPPYPEKIKHSDMDKALDKRFSGEKIPAPSGADGRLAEVVLKACSCSPTERYSSPVQMREELEAIAYDDGERLAGDFLTLDDASGSGSGLEPLTHRLFENTTKDKPPDTPPSGMDISKYKKHEPFFGSWYITKFLGEGNFGKVFEIQREDFGKTSNAALKVITVPQNKSEVRHIKDDAGVTEYFKGVVKDIVSKFILMNKLKGNNNVVSYEDHMVIPHDGTFGWDILIRMELLTPLMHHAEDAELTRNDVIKLGVDMCHALELCQKHSIVHRDIKLENIFISDSGHFKLGGFGIARTIEKTISDLSVKSTYTYIAPEVRNGEKYGANVDLYSLGIVMYRLLNENRIPFLPPFPEKIKHSDMEKALYKRFSGENIPAPSGTEQNSDWRLAEIVVKACSHNPNDGYSSPLQMREDLESLANDSISNYRMIIYSNNPPPLPPPPKCENCGGDIFGAISIFHSLCRNCLNPPPPPPPPSYCINCDVPIPHDERLCQTCSNPPPPPKPPKRLIVARAIVMSVVIIVLIVASSITAYLWWETTVFEYKLALKSEVDMPKYITIRGEQHSTSLTTLALSLMNLQDAEIAPLSYMTNLEELCLWGNQISDLSPLANLMNLTSLDLRNNQVSDLSPLASLTNLTDLSLFSNSISDLSPLANLTYLEVLWLPHNQISDLLPLADLTNLTRLSLVENHIRDLSPLANLANLTYLRLEHNQISDLSPLASLTNLTFLVLMENQIIDWSPVGHVDIVLGRPQHGRPLRGRP